MYVPSKDCNYLNLPYWISQLGSVTNEHFINHQIIERFPDFKIEKINVKCNSLNTLIKEYNISSIDNLLVDTEGHDYTILRALDLTHIKPKNIVFEHKYMDGTYKRGINFIDLTNYFFSNGYKFVKEDYDDFYLTLDTN
jgi:hypothetical protein